MSKSEVYISLDIESTGPVPGLFSMLSLGAAAFSDGQLIDTYSVNLKELPGAGRDPGTMKWWEGQAEAWKLCRAEPVWDARAAMPEFVRWLEWQPGKLVPVAWPAAFDFGMVHYYNVAFAGRDPMGFACLDLRSLVMGYTKTSTYYGRKESEMKALGLNVDNSDLKDHVALDDAIGQGRLLMAILAQIKNNEET